ncbi:MAG: hypothetical protein WC673_00610 [Candidatus Paceibacterota bacterium]|jgi:hypothetical protein
MKAKPISVFVEIEVATLDLEQAMERYTALYKNRGVKVARNFASNLREIWQRNRAKIEKTTRNLRYDAVAVIPGNLNLPEFHQQMTQGYETTWESNNFKEGGSWSGIKSFQVHQDRVVLFHDCQEISDYPLTTQLLGKNLFQVTGLSATELTERIANGKPFNGQLTVDGQKHTFDGLAVEDYLAIQAEFYSRTRNHLDFKTWSWLIRSCCGRRVPELIWSPGDGLLLALAIGPGFRYGNLAPRPAAVFV